MAKIVAVANQKGGVGKTTTSVNLAAGIALQGKRVLLVDMDPQGNATSGLGIDPRSLQKTVYNCLINFVKFEETVQNTEVNGLSLLPANADLAGAEIEMVNIEEREKLLRNFLRRCRASVRYDLPRLPPGSRNSDRECVGRCQIGPDTSSM